METDIYVGFQKFFTNNTDIENNFILLRQILKLKLKTTQPNLNDLLKTITTEKIGEILTKCESYESFETLNSEEKKIVSFIISNIYCSNFFKEFMKRMESQPITTESAQSNSSDISTSHTSTSSRRKGRKHKGRK